MSEQDDKARKAAELEADVYALLPLSVFDTLTGDTEAVEARAREIAVDFFAKGIAWARATPEWIRKSERPPEFGERILVAYGSGDFTYLECCEGRYNEDGTCEVVYRDEFGDLNDDEFTHYMLVSALPPAPEGE